jgi:hypothetical protein
MRGVALVVGTVALLAGCGGGSESSEGPETAYLTDVKVTGDALIFDFKSAPLEVKARYQPRSQLRECGSGRPVRVKGAGYVVVHFTPAASAEIKGEDVVPTYTGPKRLSGPGPVLEAAKMCDRPRLGSRYRQEATAARFAGRRFGHRQFQLTS